MSMKTVTGHFATENDEYVIVTRRSERPLGALLGFTIGCLIVLLTLEGLNILSLVMIVLTSTSLGTIFSSSQRSESIPKHRVIRILRKWGRVEVHYIIYGDPLLDALER